MEFLVSNLLILKKQTPPFSLSSADHEYPCKWIVTLQFSYLIRRCWSSSQIWYKWTMSALKPIPCILHDASNRTFAVQNYFHLICWHSLQQKYVNALRHIRVLLSLPWFQFIVSLKDQHFTSTALFFFFIVTCLHICIFVGCSIIFKFQCPLWTLWPWVVFIFMRLNR